MYNAEEFAAEIVNITASVPDLDSSALSVISTIIHDLTDLAIENPKVVHHNILKNH